MLKEIHEKPRDRSHSPGAKSRRAIAGREHWAAGIVAAIVGLPIFFSLSASGIGPPTGPTVAARGSTLSMPLSVVVITAVLLASVSQLRSVQVRPVAATSLAVFALVNTAALVYGGFRGVTSFNSVAFYLQTLLPLLGYAYGTQLFRARGKTLAETYYSLFLVPLLSLLIVGVTTLFTGGTPWLELGSRIGPLEIPQILRYVPTVFAAGAVGYGNFLFQKPGQNLRRVALLAAAAILLTAVHSRTSLLIVAAGILITVLVRPRSSSARRSKIIAWGVLFAVVLIAALPQLSDGPVALNRLVGDNEAAQLSSDRRYDALVGSFTEAFSTPFGRAYSADENFSLGGTESAVSRVSNSENQLGEFGLRAGPLAIIAILVFAGASLKQSYGVIRRSDDNDDARFMMSVWVAVASTLLVATFTQQPLSQPFPGVYLWLLLGLLRGWTTAESLRRTKSSNWQ